LPNPVKFGAISAGLGALAISVLLITAIEIGLTDLDTPARLALMIFAVAIVGWTLTPLDDTFVALAAAVAMALFVVGSPDDLFRALGDNLIWLLVAAFIFAAAFRASGLADLLVRKVALRARSVRTMFHALTAVMIGSAFIIPSTSGAGGDDASDLHGHRRRPAVPHPRCLCAAHSHCDPAFGLRIAGWRGGAYRRRGIADANGRSIRVVRVLDAPLFAVCCLKLAYRG
jgi:hypothetical protein